MASRDAQLNALLEKIHTARNFDFRNYKRETLHRRISRRMHERRCATYADYMKLLESAQPPGGAVFTPHFRQAPPEKARARPAEHPVAPTRRVLPVDDERDNLDALQALLAGEGIGVVTSESGSGREALQIVEESDRFDAVPGDSACRR